MTAKKDIELLAAELVRLRADLARLEARLAKLERPALSRDGQRQYDEFVVELHTTHKKNPTIKAGFSCSLLIRGHWHPSTGLGD